MNAMLEPVAFALPKKPRIIEKEALPDQRRLAVIPIRACTDSTLTLGMMRALVLICSYANRSGITWVSQKALADKLGVTQQAISKHLVKLTKAKYIEVLKRPVPGYSHTTWRVIYDPSVSAEDAVSITSAIEDTRAPYMKEQQMREQEEVDREGQRRVAQAISKALKQQPKRINTMPKHDATRTVKEMKSMTQKSRPKGTHAQPLKVVPQPQPQPVDNFPLAFWIVCGRTLDALHAGTPTICRAASRQTPSCTEPIRWYGNLTRLIQGPTAGFRVCWLPMYHPCPDRGL